jgi:hypothetical protein
MKAVIPWVLAVVLLGGTFYLYSAGHGKDAELAILRQEHDELAALRAESEKAKQAPDQSAELVRLRKDHEELIQLRADVSQLQEKNRQLNTQLQKAVAQGSQAQQQQAQTATEAEELRKTATALQQQQTQARTAACIASLRAIDGAKQVWALQNKKPAISTPAVSDLLPYLPGNAMPACPEGGTYSINSLTVPPACNIPGHTLPKP